MLASNLSSAFNFEDGSRIKSSGLKMGFGVNNASSIEGIVATVISVILSFLGVIFIILVIYAGFSWMTAGGNEEQVKKAQKILKNSIIGLVVVLGSYALSWLILNIFITPGENVPN
ncbi:MAG: hypothetical protein WC280_02900 [Patescibacteria group bacterium]